jgi:hypothetical protein
MKHFKMIYVGTTAEFIANMIVDVDTLELKDGARVQIGSTFIDEVSGTIYVLSKIGADSIWRKVDNDAGGYGAQA